MQINTRPGTPADVNFILATWLRSYRHGSDFAASIRTGIFYICHEAMLKALLSRPGVQVLVACDPESPEVVYGYCVTEQQDVFVLHYIYVKKSFRGFGIGKTLMPVQDTVEFTHLNRGFNSRLTGRSSFVYNPYRI